MFEVKMKSYFAENLKKFRIEKGLTVKTIAKEVGVSISTIYSWEKDKTKPNLRRLAKLAKYFDTKIDVLVTQKQI